MCRLPFSLLSQCTFYLFLFFSGRSLIVNSHSSLCFFFHLFQYYVCAFHTFKAFACVYTRLFGEELYFIIILCLLSLASFICLVFSKNFVAITFEPINRFGHLRFSCFSNIFRKCLGVKNAEYAYH